MIDPTTPTYTTPTTTTPGNGGDFFSQILGGLVGAGNAWAGYYLDRQRLNDALKYQAQYPGQFTTPGQGYPTYTGGVTQAGMFGNVPPVMILGALLLAGVAFFAKD